MGLVAPADPVPVGELGRVHFTGIGGAGMSGIARILLARGVPVSGSDAAPSELLAELAALGADVRVGHAAANVADADTLVVSTAIRQDNPELAEARTRGIRVLHRAAALASVMLGRRGVAIAGTHGKTTTTSMLTTILRNGGADPSYVIGGILAETGLGAADGGGATFIAEADESDRSFLLLSPYLAIVTCIEADHLDNYQNLAEIEAAFLAFARRITAGGLLVACADDPGARALAAAAAGSGVRVRTYGTAAGADYRVSGVTPRGMATRLTVTPRPQAPVSAAPKAEVSAAPQAEVSAAPQAEVSAAPQAEVSAAPQAAVGAAPQAEVSAAPQAAVGDPAGLPVEIGVPGRHNALNAAAALAAAMELGFPARQAISGLAAYRGARRRMELKGEADGVRVLDSYAHHPTELAADLTAARDVAAGGRVIAVFQPHLYSRTRLFAAEFGAALGRADEAIVLDVYAAREDPEPGINGNLVAAAVPGGALYLPDRAEVPAAAASLAKPGDLVLTMGAGDVTALGPLIVAALRARAGGTW